MKLVYKHNQEKHFKIIRYPDGQQSVELDMNYFNDPKQPVTMQVSIRNWMELEVYHCLWSALMKNDFIVEQIDFMYLMGMRSDRAFAVGQPNYFRDIINPQISGGRHRIGVLYPHSPIGLMYIRQATAMHVSLKEDGYYVIGADQSALWSHPNYSIYLPHFNKKRTADKVEIYLIHDVHSAIEKLPEHTPILIKDDLCDGGATFIAIAEYLEKHYPERKRELFVAHGLFTKGVDHVAKHYSQVITTNSYQDFEPHPKLQVIDVWNEGRPASTFVSS
jgi:ribose-phosphate pyrophosphokinase